MGVSRWLSWLIILLLAQVTIPGSWDPGSSASSPALGSLLSGEPASPSSSAPPPTRTLSLSQVKSLLKKVTPRRKSESPTLELFNKEFTKCAISPAQSYHLISKITYRRFPLMVCSKHTTPALYLCTMCLEKPSSGFYPGWTHTLREACLCPPASLRPFKYSSKHSSQEL